MTIKEVEEQTGLQRSQIRFYEKERLIVPERRQGNGYREYTETDVEDIKKIAYLRTLGISIGDIRRMIEKEAALSEILKIQIQNLEKQTLELNKAKTFCEKMLQQKNISFEQLDVSYYVSDLEKQWEENRNILKMDSLGFFYVCGGSVAWRVLAVVSLLIGIIAFAGLPAQIPVQWRNGEAVTLADKWFIFIYPAGCIIIRFLLRPFLRRWFWNHAIYSRAVVDYVTNYLCVLAISLQVFTILFVKGILSHVAAVFLVDGSVLAVLLFLAWKRLAAVTQE